MRPQPKDPWGRPPRGYGQRQQPGYGQQSASGQQRPAYGQPATEGNKPQQPPPKPQQQVGNVKADVVWALRNAGGGMSIFDIGNKITAAGKPRYSETKIIHILDMLVQDGKVSKGQETGRVTYKWAVEAF